VDQSIIDGGGDDNYSLNQYGSLNTYAWGRVILGWDHDLRRGKGSLTDEGISINEQKK
jgi:hypothetical protein